MVEEYNLSKIEVVRQCTSCLQASDGSNFFSLIYQELLEKFDPPEYFFRPNPCICNTINLLYRYFTRMADFVSSLDIRVRLN